MKDQIDSILAQALSDILAIPKPPHSRKQYHELTQQEKTDRMNATRRQDAISAIKQILITN